MAIQLTEAAAQRVQAFLSTEGGTALRLGVRKTGCSGWAYTVSLVDDAAAEDRIFEDRGVRVVVDPAALKLVDGTIIDFVSEGLNRTFKFSNPNVTGECGCGESFAVAG